MIDLYHLTRIFKDFGNLTRAYIEPVGKDWFVYASSSKYRRNVNTHVFSDRKEAVLTRNAINNTVRK